MILNTDLHDPRAHASASALPPMTLTQFMANLRHTDIGDLPDFFLEYLYNSIATTPIEWIEPSPAAAARGAHFPLISVCRALFSPFKLVLFFFL